MQRAAAGARDVLTSVVGGRFRLQRATVVLRQTAAQSVTTSSRVEDALQRATVSMEGAAADRSTVGNYFVGGRGCFRFAADDGLAEGKIVSMQVENVEIQ